ncbi:MAG: meiosis-specific protein HOP1 [Amphiamblys sp. WSBS2006]|nr:MAG: meiosis-specific protein HOP1 [Amphiamblys sp. WSBS2006]
MATTVATKTATTNKTKTSLKQTQQLLMTTFSCIGYLRDLFPESAFEECRMGDMTLKRIRRGHAAEADAFVDWFEKGCFDAMEKRCLRTITLEIHEREKEGHPLEVYEFNITYPAALPNKPKAQPQIYVRLTNGKSDIAETTDADSFKKAAVVMLRSVCLLTQTLEALPERKSLTMRLSYYDEAVDKAYEPAGFREATESEKEAAISTEFTFKHDFGAIRHTHHSVGFGMMRSVDGIEAQAKEERAEKTQEATFLETLPPVEALPREALPNTEPPEEEAEMAATIMCHCGINEDGGEMILCEKCRMWQHTVCAGFYSNKDKRISEEEYQCCFCRYGKNKKGFVLIKEIACFRRVLHVVYNEGMKSTEWMASRLGFPLSKARKMVERALGEGFLRIEDASQTETQQSKETQQQTRVYRVVKTPAIREAVRRYFSGSRNPPVEEGPRPASPEDTQQGKRQKMSVSKKPVLLD